MVKVKLKSTEYNRNDTFTVDVTCNDNNVVRYRKSRIIIKYNNIVIIILS